MAEQLPDSGDRRLASTGSTRDASTGKGWFHCIPPVALRAMAKRFEDGGTKYGEHNWMKGQPLSWFYNSATRHMLAWAEGKRDEDHLGAALWNMAAAAWTEEAIADGRLPVELADLPFRPDKLDEICGSVSPENWISATADIPEVDDE